MRKNLCLIAIKLNHLKQCLNRHCTVFDSDALRKKVSEIEIEEQKITNNFDFEKVKKLGKEKKSIQSVLDKIDSSVKKLSDLKVLYEMLMNENASDVDWAEFSEEYKATKSEIESLYMETLYSGKYDDSDALVELHSGAGGEEAQDWTEMLCRMYQMYSEKKGYSCQIVDFLYGEGAGYKSVTLLVEGKNAYGNLKCERGVHRLVRISPFDSNKRRHTSFASAEISPIVENNFEIVINPDDLKIDTFRSGGAGGQHINKTESAVRITHIPTGIIVSCQNERSQTQNKEMAMKMLYSKLVERAEKEKELEKLKKLGLQMKIEWGSQIRSYVLCPYTMAKDHRTGYETSDVQSVLDGNIQEFINEKLKLDKQNENFNK